MLGQAGAGGRQGTPLGDGGRILVLQISPKLSLKQLFSGDVPGRPSVDWGLLCAAPLCHF